jgi:hypothetical protein
VPTHGFLEEFQRRFFVPGLGDITFQHLALVVDGPPEVVLCAVYLHENLVKVPSPAAGFDALGPTLSDLRGEHRAEAMPPITDDFVAHIYTVLVKQILDVPQ